MLKHMKKIYREYRMKKFKEFLLNQHRNVCEIPEHVYDARKYDFSLVESYVFGLHKDNIGEYITTWEEYQPRMNETPYFVMSDDKYIFSMTFGKFVEVPITYAIIQGGKIIAVDQPISSDNLYAFLVNNQGGVIKDRTGFNGYAIYVFSVQNNRLMYKGKEISESELLDIVSKYQAGIVQSIVSQGSFENELFAESVNTIRVISMKKKGENHHEIVAALQRIGTKRSAPVDNFSQGGGSALIDLETGELGPMSCIDSFDENGNRIFYDNHPDSGAQIKGKILPRWNEIKTKIVQITEKLPYFQLIAWDIVLKDDGIALIEINMKSSLDLFQIHGGMRNKLLGQKYREHGYIKK